MSSEFGRKKGSFQKNFPSVDLPRLFSTAACSLPPFLFPAPFRVSSARSLPPPVPCRLLFSTAACSLPPPVLCRRPFSAAARTRRSCSLPPPRPDKGGVIGRIGTVLPPPDGGGGKNLRFLKEGEKKLFFHYSYITRSLISLFMLAIFCPQKNCKQRKSLPQSASLLLADSSPVRWSQGKVLLHSMHSTATRQVPPVPAVPVPCRRLFPAAACSLPPLVLYRRPFLAATCSLPPPVPCRHLFPTAARSLPPPVPCRRPARIRAEL